MEPLEPHCPKCGRGWDAGFEYADNRLELLCPGEHIWETVWKARKAPKSRKLTVEIVDKKDIKK